MRINILACGQEDATKFLDIQGQRWSLQEQQLGLEDNTLDFTCISYTWGDGRILSPFHPDSFVSDRTVPALKTTVYQRPRCRGIWIDALCVPSIDEADERAATLESMGFIYSQATEVIVVLSSRARTALEQIHRGLELLPGHLDDLEDEEWSSRAWTYQEAVNSRTLILTCEESPQGLVVDLYQFFSCLGQALNRLNAAEGVRYPRLTSLEDVMADYATAGYLERSALQVMAVMDQRTQTRPEDHFYAMIGAISTEPAASANVRGPCESFVTLCERKGDYSFIYSPTERDPTPGRRWRPIMGEHLPAILRLHSWGDGQRGYLEDETLYLEDMIVLQPKEMDIEAIEFVKNRLAAFNECLDLANVIIETTSFETLRELGFSGSGDFVSTARGLFFASTPLPEDEAEAVLVANGIHWTLGAPGLARYSQGDVKSYVPGVLLGKIRPVSEYSPTSVRME